MLSESHDLIIRKVRRALILESDRLGVKCPHSDRALDAVGRKDHAASGIPCLTTVTEDRAHAKSSSPRCVPHQIDLLSVCNKSTAVALHFLRSLSPL